MNKIATYLQEHISGEILTSASARRYFSTDASVLTLVPSIIVYPKNASDLRKVARFCWQLAEKGHRIPITARGRGTDLGGAAIGQGLILVFPAHMNHILELDPKQRLIRFQPGITFRTLQDAVETHRLFLPPYPASYNYSSVGGAIANNSGGEKSVKYGTMREYVRNLEVILANGDVIQTKRLSKKELNQKKGLQTLEGEIYRKLDGLVADNSKVIEDHEREFSRLTKRASGYDLGDIKRPDGSFDLTPLLVGSQGTLAIISEAILGLEPYVPVTTLGVIECEDIDQAQEFIEKVRGLSPSALEMVDSNLLKAVAKTNPSLLKGVLKEPYPDIVLLVEFDDVKASKQQAKVKKLEKFIRDTSASVRFTREFAEQQNLWSVRHTAALAMAHTEGGKSALPFIEDAIVPSEKLKLLLRGLYELLGKHHLNIAVWGHAGDANLHVQPMMDLSQLSDRQRMLKLMDEYHKLVIKLGGSISAEHNDGRLRAPYVEMQHGAPMYKLYIEIKKLFDPYDILNPGVKFGTDMKDIVSSLRAQYSVDHLHDYLPYT